MNFKSIFSRLILIVLLLVLMGGTDQHLPNTPDINVRKSWTYWWWMGNNVTKEEIYRHLSSYAAAGMGGVHIVPIYGVKGEESDFVNFLSEQYLELLNYTFQTAKDLGLGVDMSTGTGWPCGGPNVSRKNSAHQIFAKSFVVRKGDFFRKALSKEIDTESTLVSVTFHGGGQAKAQALTPYIDTSLNIDFPVSGDGTIFVFYSGSNNQHVERAAPGGEGFVIDHFNALAVQEYLKRFDEALSHPLVKGLPRSMYNDSYEVHTGNWTPRFEEEFKARRGYDPKPFLHFLFEPVPGDSAARFWSDYHETISDLIFDNFTTVWVEWCHQRGIKTRNQAHGSPGNILDLYGLADMPETESFGASGFSIPLLRIDEDYSIEDFGQPDPIILKFASSPSNLLGKALTCSETCTWISNHFKAALSMIKPQIDELFVSGINHVFYTGMVYSPEKDSFPGRQFYAAPNFGINGGLWQDMPELNRYVTNCQKILQSTSPDNDILVYFPVYDIWDEPGGKYLIRMLSVHKPSQWLGKTSLDTLAHRLLRRGWSFDFCSDLQLSQLQIGPSGEISAGGNTYKVILVPPVKNLPVSTIAQLNRIAQSGGNVIFSEPWAIDVPGLHQYKEREKKAALLIKELKSCKNTICGTFNESMLVRAGARRESMADMGLSFLRKKDSSGSVFFITNLRNIFSESWIPLSVKTDKIFFYDPLSGKQGLAKTRIKSGETYVYLQLQPGASCFISTSGTLSEAWAYHEPATSPIVLPGPWELTFIKGKPELPDPEVLKTLTSWTLIGDDRNKYFSGTAKYQTTFTLSAEQRSFQEFWLDLGDVRETANVWVNGHSLGKSWCVPFRVFVPGNILHQENTLTIEINNLEANHVIWLDKNNIHWKKFYDINFVNIQYQPFDASNWTPISSGLIGPVVLIPLQKKKSWDL